MTVFSFDGTRDGTNPIGSWVVTDWTEGLELDCDSDDADLGDVLGTLIKQLIQKGILKGSVTTK